MGDTMTPAAPPAARCHAAPCPEPAAPGRLHCAEHLGRNREYARLDRRRRGMKPAPPLLRSGLTLRQHALLCFLFDHMTREGRMPTIREVMARFRIGSTNGVVGHYRLLAAKGLLAWDEGSHRGVRLLGVRWVPHFTDDYAGDRLRAALAPAGEGTP